MTSVRPKGGRREYPFQNPNQRGGKGKWNNTQHSVSSGSRPNQSIHPQATAATPSPASPQHHSSSPTSTIKSLENAINDDNAAKHMHDRMLYLLVNLVGMNVQITVRSGVKYEGLFHTACTEGELGVVLKLARKLQSKSADKMISAAPVIPKIIILAKDCMEIHATGVDFTASEKVFGEREGFRTDMDISGRSEIRERELHKWSPEEHSGEAIGGLEDEVTADPGNGAWDQFAVNEQLFGLKTDFDEEIYTTKLDRSRADYKERERQAIQIANEITRSSTTNVHMLEERGFVVEDSHMDEEERYGAVVRSRDPNKYMPPPLRKLQEAQAAKKEPPPKENVKETKPKAQEDPKIPNATTTPPASVPKPAPLPTPTVASSLSHYRIAEPVSALLNASAVVRPADKRNIQRLGDIHPPKPIEAEIVGTFRKFVTNEKERLQQKKQALFKKEKDGRVAELIKFSQNFKLNTPVPPDLIPILSKDQAKREELAAKSATLLAEKEKVKDIEKEKRPPEKVVKASTVTEPKPESIQPVDKSQDEKQRATSKEPSVPEQDDLADKQAAFLENATSLPSAAKSGNPSASSGFKFNVKAMEFKPNPGAPSFTPTSEKKAQESSPFFGNKQLRTSSVSLKDSFSPFLKGKLTNPNSVAPTWPFGQRPFRHHFAVTNTFDEDMYAQAAVSQGFGFPYQVPYRYPGPFVGVPSIAMQQAAPMPYINPQFVPNIPFTAPMTHPGAPPTMYNPQMPPPHGQQHFGTQGFPSPGRAPMGIPAGIHPQMYPYQGPHVAAPIMRYPPDMVPHVSPNGMVMGHQRPMLMEQPPNFVQPDGNPMEGIPPTSEPSTMQ